MSHIYAEQNLRLSQQMLKQQGEINELKAKLAAIRELAENWRYKGEFGWGPWQEGYGPDHEGEILDNASAELRRILDDTGHGA